MAQLDSVPSPERRRIELTSTSGEADPLRSDQPTAPGHRPLGRWQALVLDIVLPFLLYQALTAAGVTGAQALAASAVLPLASIVAHGVRQHTLDALGLVSVLFILAGIAVGWVSQDPVWALLTGSSVTAVLGLGFLVSLLREHPLAF
jgi:hypothetical protein